MKISDYIANYIASTGVNTVFGYQGSNIAHLIDSIASNDQLKYVQNYHEQGSGFAACGYALLTGNTGIAVSSSGPGAANLLGGIANAFFDSVPCVFITGQLSTTSLNHDHHIRQKGFQEMDICSICSPITKFSVRITEPDDVPYYIEKAFFIANHMRKGPVLIDLPHNIQNSQIEPDKCSHFLESKEHRLLLAQIPHVDDLVAQQIAELIATSKRPLILLGQGVSSLENNSKLISFINRINAPVCTSMLGISAIRSNYIFNLGMIGSYGERIANLAAAACDLLIVLGSRIDPHQMGGDYESFAHYAKVIHVDIDEYELGHSIKEDISVHASCQEFLEKMDKFKIDRTDNKWLQHIISLKTVFQNETDKSSSQLPVQFIKSVTDMINPGSTICADVGQNLIWSARGTRIKEKTHFLCSGGYGSMGFAIPSAIGASLANGSTVIAFVGDGGFQMNLQELGVITRENLPVITIILKNNSLGMIRSYQKKVLGRYPGSVDGFTSPDYEMIAKAYNLDFYNVPLNDPLILKNVISLNRPALCVVEVDQNIDLEPEPAYKKPFYDQSPSNVYDIESYLNELLSII